MMTWVTLMVHMLIRRFLALAILRERKSLRLYERHRNIASKSMLEALYKIDSLIILYMRRRTWYLRCMVKEHGLTTTLIAVHL